jgi:hypothetical protein
MNRRVLLSNGTRTWDAENNAAPLSANEPGVVAIVGN